jgi:signal transduction histidine kinase/CheY-like chemotaxis protein
VLKTILKTILKNMDILFVVLLFSLCIPLEYHEKLSLFENQTISIRHALRSMVAGQKQAGFDYDKIVLVTIDEDFYEAYGKFPLTRKDLARLIDNLNSLGAEVICLDLFMGLPSAYGQDIYLIKSLKKNNVVVASHALFDDNGRFEKLEYPVTAIREVSRSGYVNLISPSTSHTYLSRLRIYPEISKLKDGWPIAVQVLSMYLNQAPVLSNQNLIIGNHHIPLDQFNDIYIDFSSIPDGIHFLHEVAGISAHEFLNIQHIDPFERMELREWVDGKIVFIGETMSASNDWFDTPVGMIYGVEIIADTLNTLMKNGPLVPAPLWAELFVSFLFLSTLILVARRIQSPGIREVSAAAIFLVYVVIASALYVYRGIVFSMIYNLFAGIVSFTVLDLSSYLRDRKEHMMQRNQAMADLQKAHDELEERVGHRTAELAEAKEVAEDARQVAETANRAKSLFLANMSHELRTPLNAILGFSQLIMRDPNLTMEQQRNLATIGRSGEHLLSLINDVLEYSKIEAGKLVINPENFDLHRLLFGIEEMFRLRAEQIGLQLIYELDPNVPQYVHTDQNKVRQLLINLLGNAVKFTKQGSITLRVSATRIKEADPDEKVSSTSASLMLRFEVADTGVGIAPDELDKVFEAFYQSESGLKSNQGTGLGLSISNQFVRLMGGRLIVKSEVGKGTLFYFDIRAEHRIAADVPEARTPRSVIGLKPDQSVLRLLVVEDNETNRNLITMLLERTGFEVREAVNGKEAIEICKKWQPHLIWMDMRMPLMDGFEATRIIKSETYGKGTTIIALTASVFDQDREKVLACGCDDFVLKPFRENEIFDMLHKHLGVRFLYEENKAQDRKNKAGDDVELLTPEMLATLSEKIRGELKKAADAVDFDSSMDIINRIRKKHESLAGALEALIESYQFDVLQQLLYSEKKK